MKRGGPLRRTTPLRSTTPLKRTPLARSTPIAPAARPRSTSSPRRGAIARRRGDTGPTREVTVLLWNRAAGRCEICGRSVVGVAASRHHRQPRGMGGRPRRRIAGAETRVDVNALSNLLLLCGTGTVGCHGWVEVNREHAYLMGWLVPRAYTPAEVPASLSPLVTGHVGPVYLTDDGDYALGAA